MKPKLTIGLSILISLLLLAFGLVYGSVSGYADERAHVNALLEGDSGLLTVINYRASDALNLCVVADRHIAGDADVAALRAAAKALRETEPSLAAEKIKDDALTAAFGAVAAKLQASQSFAQSARDRQYLEMLSADFAQYAQNAIYATYNKAAADYNQKLTAPVMGDLARFFGIKPCELFR